MDPINRYESFIKSNIKLEENSFPKLLLENEEALREEVETLGLYKRQTELNQLVEYLFKNILTFDEESQNWLKSLQEYELPQNRPFERKFPLNAMQKQYSHKLTPLHLAVMLHKNELVKELLKWDLSNPNVQDFRGWTPAHHAAATANKEILDLLIRKTNHLLKTIHNGTILDLYKLATSYKRDFSNVTTLIEEDNEIKEVSQQRFQQLTGKVLVNEFISAPSLLVEEWERNPNKNEDCSEELNRHLKNKLVEYRRDPTPVALYKEERAGLGVKYVGDQPLPAGSIVAPYYGLIMNQDDIEGKDSEYRLANVTAFHYRSIASMINDSFPNTVFLPMKNHEGIAVANVVMTIREIKKGEPLSVDYGLCLLKNSGPHRELHLDQVERSVDTLRGISAKCRASGVHNIYALIPARLALFADVVKAGYLVHTPKLLISMFLQGKLSRDAFQEMLQIMPYSEWESHEMVFSTLFKIDERPRSEKEPFYKILGELFLKLDYQVASNVIINNNLIFNHSEKIRTGSLESNMRAAIHLLVETMEPRILANMKKFQEKSEGDTIYSNGING